MKSNVPAEVDTSLTEALGGETAQDIFTTHLNSGKTYDQLAEWHSDHAAWLANDARTPDGKAFAAGYARTADSMLAELCDLEAAGGKPPTAPEAATLRDGTPHADPFLAGRGWQAERGVYVRRAAEPDAGYEIEAA